MYGEVDHPKTDSEIQGQPEVAAKPIEEHNCGRHLEQCHRCNEADHELLTDLRRHPGPHRSTPHNYGRRGEPNSEEVESRGWFGTKTVSADSDDVLPNSVEIDMELPMPDAEDYKSKH